jgi:hypothetical protein
MCAPGLTRVREPPGQTRATASEPITLEGAP